jgi:hypothetical protein
MSSSGCWSGCAATPRSGRRRCRAGSPSESDTRWTSGRSRPTAPLVDRRFFSLLLCEGAWNCREDRRPYHWVESCSPGYACGMGLLTRWDAHNQRTLEWQEHVNDEGPPTTSRWAWIAIAAMWLAIGALRREVQHYFGFAWTIGALVGLGLACIMWLFVTQRRKRRSWELSRQSPRHRADRTR